MDKVSSDAEWDLEEKLRHADDENGLRELDQKIQQEEIQGLKKQVGILEMDGLTGANRREIFESEFKKIFDLIRNKEDEQRHGVGALKNATLICIDLDKFKRVNDTFGHSVGDEVLQKVSKIMKESLRAMDMLARLGGDEFAVLLPNTNEKNGVMVAEKIRHSIEEDSRLKSLGVTVSVGVCSSEVSTAEDPETFLAHADQTAYVAKRAGGNRVEVYK